MEQVTRCFIGLGSNLGDREAAIRRAITLLQVTTGIRLLGTSKIQNTKPIGPIQDQPDFLNAVVAIETLLTPLELLDRMQAIETQLGRVRSEHWGPRTIDLDLLLYGDQSIETPRLTVPHPEIANRDFWQEGLDELRAVTEPQTSKIFAF